MSLDAFLAAIKADALRAVAEHWRDARAGRRMPAWRHIDPVALGKNLPLIWSWKYDRATAKFTGRLSGEEITNAFGKSLRGAKHEEFFPKDEQERVFRLHQRVVTEPAFARGEGKVFSHVGRVGIGERIILPLSEDGILGDGIFGATVYEVFEGQQSVEESRWDQKLTFFALD